MLYHQVAYLLTLVQLPLLRFRAPLGSTLPLFVHFQRQAQEDRRKGKHVRKKMWQKDNGKATQNKKTAPKRPRPEADSSSSEEEEELCIICMDTYRNSKPKEQWLKCAVVTCNNWAHEACTVGRHTFFCRHCESDCELD